MSALKITLFVLFAAALTAGVLASPSWAEPEGEMDEVSAKIKTQMEKIIRLMRENEDALLELSTGRKARPRRVDVEPPVPPESQSAAGAGKKPDPSGAEAAREIEKLVREQKRAGERIPIELEELVRMVPL